MKPSGLILHFFSSDFNAGQISTCLTPPVFEHIERTVIEFSAKSMSLHLIRFISLGLTPANIRIATAGRQWRNLSFWAVSNICRVWDIERGLISLSITFFFATSLTMFLSHHCFRTANSNRPWSIVLALLNCGGVLNSSFSEVSHSSADKSEKFFAAKSELLLMSLLPRYFMSLKESLRRFFFLIPDTT